VVIFIVSNSVDKLKSKRMFLRRSLLFVQTVKFKENASKLARYNNYNINYNNYNITYSYSYTSISSKLFTFSILFTSQFEFHLLLLLVVELHLVVC